MNNQNAEVINVKEKFSLFTDHWKPRIIAELNGQQVKLAKVKGEFVWHDHAEEDELFLVIKGELQIETESGTRILREGELSVIPRGLRHRPMAAEECWILLFEPAKTKHTGEVEHELTVEESDWI